MCTCSCKYKCVCNFKMMFTSVVCEFWVFLFTFCVTGLNSWSLSLRPVLKVPSDDLMGKKAHAIRYHHSLRFNVTLFSLIVSDNVIKSSICKSVMIRWRQGCQCCFTVAYIFYYFEAYMYTGTWKSDVN